MFKYQIRLKPSPFYNPPHLGIRSGTQHPPFSALPHHMSPPLPECFPMSAKPPTHPCSAGKALDHTSYCVTAPAPSRSYHQHLHNLPLPSPLFPHPHSNSLRAHIHQLYGPFRPISNRITANMANAQKRIARVRSLLPRTSANFWKKQRKIGNK